MRIHAEEIQAMYKDFFKAEKNQVEINQGLRSAFLNFSELSAFQGDGAQAAKDYMRDVHLSVVDGFNSALMELEIRMLQLEADFRCSVDSSDVAILDCNYIQTAFKTKVLGFQRTYKDIHEEGEDAIKDIDFLGLAPIDVRKVDDYLQKAYDHAEKTIKSMSSYPEGFEARHAHDLDEINNTFLPAIDKALSYMKSLRKDGRISYSKGDMEKQADGWYGDIQLYNLVAYEYGFQTDPDFLNTMYLAMAADTGVYLESLYLHEAMGDDISYEEFIKQVHGVNKTMTTTGAGLDGTLAMGYSSEISEFLKFVRSGLTFKVKEVTPGGNKYLSITSLTGGDITKADMLKRLQNVGLDFEKVKSRNLSKMFSEGGLLVWSKNPKSYTKVFDLAEGDWKALANLKETIKGVDDLDKTLVGAKNVLEKVDKMSKVASVAGAVIDVGADFADACYDERNQSLSLENIDGAHFWEDLAVDTVQIIAPLAASAAAGAAYGSVVPGIGTAVGAVVGIVIFALNTIECGEPPQPVIDHVKDWVGDRFDDIDNAFTKWFT